MIAIGYDCEVEETGTYLRRNVWAMGRVRHDMATLGMGFDHYTWDEVPSFPKTYPGEDHFDDDGDPVTDEARVYEEACEVARKWRPEHPGIAMHKLSSNDGWLVTEEECREALKAYQAAGSPELPGSFGDDWIPFLREAAHNGGFRVW